MIRQNTRWKNKGNVLTGGIADPSYQKKLRQAKEDNYDGTRPVLLLKCVPKAFVLPMRLRYNEIENKGRDRGSLLNLGHDVNSSILRDGDSVFSLQKQTKLRLPEAFFPLNVSNNVTLELKLLILVNDKEKLIAAPS